MKSRSFECPSCAMEVERGAEECPYCGYEFPPERSSLKAMAILLALLLAWPVFELISRLLE